MTLEQAILILSVLTGGNFIAMIVTVYTARSSKKNIDSQSSNNDAGAVRQYAEATALYAKEVTTLRSELGRLRNVILRRDQMIDHLNELLVQKTITIEDLKKWAEALVAQLNIVAPEIEPARLQAREIVVHNIPETDTLSADAEIPTQEIEERKGKK